LEQVGLEKVGFDKVGATVSEVLGRRYFEAYGERVATSAP
jgi:hypothetical protein